MIEVTVTQEEHSLSYEVGFLLGSREAPHEGVLSTNEIESDGIKAWQQAKKIMPLDMVDFVEGFVGGYSSYLNGLI